MEVGVDGSLAMEVVVEWKFGNGSGYRMEVGIEWKFGNRSTYNGSVQWMTLPSHRTYSSSIV